MKTAEDPAAALQSLLDGLQASRDSLKQDLDVVHNYAAEESVTLGSVSADAKSINISGSAATEEQVLKYYGRLLYDSGRFSTVMINTLTVGDESVEFSMALTR